MYIQWATLAVVGVEKILIKMTSGQQLQQQQ